MDWLLAQDENLLLAINGSHSGWADVVMTILSNKLAWIPVYVLLAYLLLAIVVLVPVILISDQVASGLLKNLVARPRPCHEPGLMEMLHLVGNKCGGEYGFASSHASNFFALATYLSWHFGKRISGLP